MSVMDNDSDVNSLRLRSHQIGQRFPRSHYVTVNT